MAINLASTSDSPEAVTAALGDLAQKPVVEEKPAEGTEDVPEVISEETEGEVVEGTVEPEEIKDDEDAEENEEDSEPEVLEAKEGEQVKPKKKGGFQKRIDKLNGKLSATEQEKEYWRQEALRAQQKAQTQETTPVKVEANNRPKQSDYATHDEYIDALTDWKVDNKLSAEREKQKVDAVKNEVQAKFNQHYDRVDAFKKTHDDFEELVGTTVVYPPAIQEAILLSDIGPDIMYELGKNPTEYARIKSLSPVLAAKEIGKIEVRLAKPAPKTTVKKPKTSTPVTPVRTRGAVNAKSIYDADKLSQRDYDRMRDEQLKQKSMGR